MKHLQDIIALLDSDQVRSAPRIVRVPLFAAAGAGAGAVGGLYAGAFVGVMVGGCLGSESLSDDAALACAVVGGLTLAPCAGPVGVWLGAVFGGLEGLRAGQSLNTEHPVDESASGSQTG